MNNIIVQCAGDLLGAKPPVPPPARLPAAQTPLPQIPGLSARAVSDINAELSVYFAEREAGQRQPIGAQSPARKTPPSMTPEALAVPRRTWFGDAPRTGDHVYVDILGFDVRGVIRDVATKAKVIIAAGSIRIEADPENIFRAPPPNKSSTSFSSLEIGQPKSVLHIVDLHGLHVRQVDNRLQTALLAALRDGAAALQVIHGYRRGDALLRRVHTLARLEPLSQFVTRVSYAPAVNPGVTILGL